MFWGRLERLFQDGAQLSTEDQREIESECIEYRIDHCMNCQCIMLFPAAAAVVRHPWAGAG